MFDGFDSWCPLMVNCLFALFCLFAFWGSFIHFLSTPRVLLEAMSLPFGYKFGLLISFEFQVILFQALCVLNDKFFNGMSQLQQVLKRPCGPSVGNGGWKLGGRGFRAGRSEFAAARTAESRSVGDVCGSHVYGSRSFEVNEPPLGHFRRSLVGGGTSRNLSARREKTSLASTSVHGHSRGRSPHSKEGHENSDRPRRTSRWRSPIERFGLAARVATGSRDRSRKWQAVRRGSNKSFFSGSVRPACGTRKHGRDGSRPEAECSRESDPERSRRRRSAKCEKENKWGERICPFSGADTSSARSREEVVEQSGEAVTPTPQDRKSLLRVKLEGVRAAFNATKPRETASRREEGRSEDHGNSRHDFRGNGLAPTRAQEEEFQQRRQRRHKRIRHFEQRNSEGGWEAAQK